jgi:hypothetical protein
MAKTKFFVVLALACLILTACDPPTNPYAECKALGTFFKLSCTCTDGSSKGKNFYSNVLQLNSDADDVCLSTPAAYGSIISGNDNFQAMEQNRQTISNRILIPISYFLSITMLGILMMISYPKLGKKFTYAWGIVAGTVSLLLVFFRSGK